MIKHWIKATRPKTLPASIIPVAIGSAAAYSYGEFHWHLSVIALLCAIFIQIITNYLNEVYDYYRGADTEERKGPQRIVAAGIVSPKKMLFVSIFLIVITFLLGLILVGRGGLPILIIGILSLIFAYAYTGGPFPLAYNGLGDIFVLIFFGIIAVCGTFYVQTLTLTSEVFIASLGPGLLSMNLLGINNIRDIKTDIKAGKITLAVKLGEKKAKTMYFFVNFSAFLVPVALTIMTGSAAMLLPLAVLPYSIIICRKLRIYKDAELNKLLAATGKLLLLHGTLTVLGFVIN
jgi:1,4-dihydroxy-2-naphthoate octaprenyltransferase